MSVIEDESARSQLKSIAREYNKQIITDRGMETESQVLEVIRELQDFKDEPSIKEITNGFIEHYGEDYERRVTAKWIGGLIRKKLNIKPEKREEGFVIPVSEKEKLRRLYEKYGLLEKESDTDHTPTESLVL